ncbi:transposase [Kribbella deserti]|uniref:Transposase n=1 Tax=Kribbella deserti TaxID=1926257 RepID=A0ABV6QN89_9ACTN
MIIKKRQRRLTGIDGLVISLSTKGLTHGEICTHLGGIYSAEAPKQTISTITDRFGNLAKTQTSPVGGYTYSVRQASAYRTYYPGLRPIRPQSIRYD